MREARFLPGRIGRLAVGRVALVAFGFAVTPVAAGASAGRWPETVGVEESFFFRKQRLERPETPIEAGLGDWNTTDALRTLGAGLLLAYGALLLARRRKRPAVDEAEARERRVADAVAAIRPGVDEASRLALVPRTLPHSPFTAVDAATLEGQIEIAAEACVRLSRTVGLVYFEVPAYAEIERQEGKQRADEIVSALAEALRHYLRVTDHVAILDGNRIVVCVCLLDKATDLEGVAKRLAVIVQRHKLGGEANALVRPGLSVYPLHGYSGAELIAAAERNYRAAPAAGEPLEPWVAPAEVEALDPSLRPDRETPGKKPVPGSRARSKLTVVTRPEDEKEPPPS